MELFKQHDLDGHLKDCLRSMKQKIAEYESLIEFVATVNERKDCLMAQDKTQDDPSCMWFNIDIPKGHGIRAGDRVRITIEKI